MERADPRRAQLRRLKLYALAMLLAMLAGFVASHLNGERGAWAWVGAFCEAATVGALADWFAVVALFRRPLNLPIPHTAIIPRNKARIADSLAVFVRDHFLEPEALLARLKVFDPATRLGQWLAQPQQARMLAGMEEQGLIKRTRSSADQRRQEISLTVKSNKLIDRMRPMVDAKYQEIEERIGKELLDRLYRDVDAMVDLIKRDGPTRDAGTP